MSSPTIITSPSRRHQLSPVKPMKSNRLRGANLLNRNSSIGVSTYPTATKRSHSDENSDPSPAFIASPHKRVKSALSPALNAVLKSAPVPRASKRAFGTLVDVTNTRANTIVPLKGRGGNGVFVDKAPFGKSTFGKPARTILKPHSPTKKVSPSSSPKQSSSPSRRAAARIRAPSPRRGIGRGNKRAYNPPAFKRVDPPSYFNSASSPTSIDSLLATVISTRPSLFTIPTNKVDVVARKDDAPPLIAANIPDSWIFDIYEDSPEETLQNLMEHSTHTLDISDDSDAGSDTSELQEKGKENISPARLAELLAIAPVERGNAMRVDIVDKAIPQQYRRARREIGEHREALREMQKEELLLSLPEPEKSEKKAATEEVEKLPTPPVSEKTPPPPQTPMKTVEEESESEEDAVATTPKSPGSPGWVVWESEHEHESEDEVTIASKIPLPPSSKLDFELEEQQPGFDVDAASLYGASDQE